MTHGTPPVIGISAYRQTASWGGWTEPADLLPADYSQSVELAGGLPVLLPPLSDAEAAVRVIERLDGLIISGGGDVNPDRYRARAHPQTAGVADERDSWELRLLDAAAARGLPILGICRGMQVLAVWAGGTLTQHLPDDVGHTEHSPAPDRFGELEVTTEAGTLARSLLGTSLRSHCHHHQAVVEHPGFIVSARGHDGVTEAIEAPDQPFRLGVQWHPEKVGDLALFKGLVGAAAGSAQPEDHRPLDDEVDRGGHALGDHEGDHPDRHLAEPIAE